MKGLLNLGVIVLFGYGAMLLYVYLAQARLLYLPDFAGDDLIATPDRLGFGFEDVSLLASDGVELHGWFVPAGEARGTVLFMHGNAGNISHRLESIERFNRLQLNVFIFDYRGYGQSKGKPTEEGTYRDARAAWRYLVDSQGIAPESIVLFGRSLGAAVAARLATETTPAALIVESGFTSVPDAAAGIYWFLPVRLLSRFQYDAREAIRKVACPVLVVHSRDDEIIPFTHGQALYESAPRPKSFLELTGGHNEAIFMSGPRYEQGLQAFLDSALAE
jgi:fermentation-respiration switch protein FrsA (DUF1100 family)